MYVLNVKITILFGVVIEQRADVLQAYIVGIQYQVFVKRQCPVQVQFYFAWVDVTACFEVPVYLGDAVKLCLFEQGERPCTSMVTKEMHLHGVIVMLNALKQIVRREDVPLPPESRYDDSLRHLQAIYPNRVVVDGRHLKALPLELAPDVLELVVGVGKPVGAGEGDLGADELDLLLVIIAAFENNG